MPGMNTLFSIIALAWFIPAFFFTYYHFAKNPKKDRKDLKSKMRFWLEQLSFILWPIILVISTIFKLISKLVRRKVKNK